MKKFIVNAYKEYSSGDVDDYYFFTEAETAEEAIQKVKESGRVKPRYETAGEFRYYVDEITEDVHFIVNDGTWN